MKKKKRRPGGRQGDCTALAGFGRGRCVLPFFFSSRRRHTRWNCDWSSDVCSSDLNPAVTVGLMLSKRFPAHEVPGYIAAQVIGGILGAGVDRKSTRLNSSHSSISYAVFCLKKKKKI